MNTQNTSIKYVDLLSNNLHAANQWHENRNLLKLCFLFSSQDTDHLIPDSLTTDVSPLSLAASTNTAVDAIIDVLKYSQKDMDAAVELVKKEVW